MRAPDAHTRFALHVHVWPSGAQTWRKGVTHSHNNTRTHTRKIPRLIILNKIAAADDNSDANDGDVLEIERHDIGCAIFFSSCMVGAVGCSKVK